MLCVKPLDLNPHSGLHDSAKGIDFREFTKGRTQEVLYYLQNEVSVTNK